MIGKIGQFCARVVGSLPSRWRTEFQKAEYTIENVLWDSRNRNSFPVLFRGLQKFKCQGDRLNGWALAEISVKELFAKISPNIGKPICIVELGSGQSTLLWDSLAHELKISVSTLEHDAPWFEMIGKKIRNKNSIHLFYAPIRQVSNDVRESIFNDNKSALEKWRSSATDVPLSQYSDTRLHNAFYDISDSCLATFEKIDILIVDGPHGNGRSLCYPILKPFLHAGTMILIDDYHHYPFLNDLGLCFEYEVIKEKRYLFSNKGWVIVEVKKVL